MEDVLDVCALQYDENCPAICLDEKPYQLLGEYREPIPTRAGKPEKIDNEYQRNGTCSIFMMCEPLKGCITLTHANAAVQRIQLCGSVFFDESRELGSGSCKRVQIFRRSNEISE